MRCTMLNLKNYLYSIFLTIITIILTLTLITTLYYFDIISPTVYNILKIVLLLISIFINNYLIGKKSLKKGYISGIKLSLPIILIFFLISLLTKTFSPKTILYYSIILTTGILGSMLGINTKKEL